jgi:hypothetical protein
MNKKRRGPNMETCGTSAFIDFHSEFDPFKTTRWDRPERYLSSHTKRLPDIPYCFSLNNNLLCHYRSKALLTDDTSLYVTVDTPQNAADIINRNLEKIHQWSVNWLVKFNPQKAETMVISRNLIKPLHPPLEMNSQIPIVRK